LLARGAGSISKTASENLGWPAGELCELVADRLRGDASAEKALAEAQAKPDSKIKQIALQAAIAGKMEDDADFAEEIRRLVETIKKEGAGAGSSAFDQRGQKLQTQTNIAGSVQGSSFSGQFNGPTANGGDAVDARGVTSFAYKPTYNYIPPKSEESSRIPSIQSPPPDFTGRDEELAELLMKFATGINAILLHGNGGVGKTALALKLAQSLKDRYPDGQIMVDMMGTTDPISSIEAMGSIINSFNPEEKIPDSKAKVMQRFQQVLNGKCILLLLDNALNDKQLSGLISPPNGCGLLVTSRNVISGLLRKDIGVLKLEHAVKLLLGICFTALGKEKSSRDDPAWPKIASLCGHLPLALRAAASFLANSEDISPKDYAQQLKDERTRLEMIGEQGVEMSVDASFGLSFQSLAPAIQKTFLDLSVFLADFDSQAEEQICQDAGHRNLSELLRWSLVDFTAQGSDYGRYRVHDLARLLAFARLPDESRATIAERHATYFRDLLAAANHLYLQGSAGVQAGLVLFDREEANILAGHTRSCESLEAGSQAAELCMSYPDAGVYVIYLRLHPMQRISWLEDALKAARKLKNRSAEGVHLGNLGLACADLGDAKKAIEYYEQALAISREIGDRRGEGTDLGNLGIAYKNLGDARKAIKYHEQSLAISREIGDRRGEGADLGSLGLAYAALGDAKKAIEYHEQVLAMAREIGDRRSEGAVLGNLGIAYAALGDAKKAIKYYEQSLAIARDLGDRRREGAVLGNLGSAYAALGDAKKAIKYYEQSLAIAREIGDRRNEGNWLGNLGLAYADLGDAKKAIEYYEQARAIAREIGDRRGEALSSWSLGLAYEKAGDLERAAEMMQVCVDYERKIGHPDAEKDAARLEAIRAKLKS